MMREIRRVAQVLETRRAAPAANRRNPASQPGFTPFAALPSCARNALGHSGAAWLSDLQRATSGQHNDPLARPLRRLLALVRGGVDLPVNYELRHGGRQEGEWWHGWVRCHDGADAFVGILEWIAHDDPRAPQPPSASVIRVTVARQHQRRGVATALLAHASFDAGTLPDNAAGSETASWARVARERVAKISLAREDLPVLVAAQRLCEPRDAVRARMIDTLTAAFPDPPGLPRHIAAKETR